jgi:sec-independent protein translocase protein TatB
MFDIGFMELVLIAVVALIVVGPERLPGAIRTTTLWIGRAKRSFQQVKTEIEREINADEIRRQLHNESILAGIEKARKQADSLVKNARHDIDAFDNEIKTTLKSEEAALREIAAREDAALKAAPAQPAAAQTPAGQPARETPAAPVDDPSIYDEAPLEEQAGTADTEPAPAAAPATPAKPVEDFYNNPPSGTISLKGGVYRATTSLDDETDSGRRI